MKINSLLIIVTILIMGCETTNFSVNNKTSKSIKNSRCEDVKSFKIFQVLDNFVLGNVCKNNDDLCIGHTVYLQKEKGKIYFDDQIITAKEDECISYTGTYQYETQKAGIKTVPIVKFVNSSVPNPEYDGN